MEGIWIEIRIITKSEALEPISSIFYGLDCKGVAIEDPEDLTCREKGPLTWDFADINILEYKGKAAVVKGYFSEEINIEEIETYIKGKVEEIRDFGIDVGEGKVISTKINEEDWANNWKKYYKPTKIGNSIIIKPMWEDYEPGKGEIVVDLDPGMAFGTGTHETTRMCVAALEKYTSKDTVVFDIGTGSGILAIVAAKLGAKHVVGVDLDPVAVESAKENLKLNASDNIEILEGNLLDVVEGKADLVVANILAEIICFVVEDVKKALSKGGIFISSGIIHDRRQMVIDKLEESGFEVVEVNIDGEWNCIVAKLK